MNITKEEIKKLSPCSDGYQWFIDHGSPDLTKTLLDINKVNPGWARWLYAKLMNGKQRKQFTIYAAKEVLHIFEAEYPNDDRPRLAIEAAKRALESNTPANREAARDAADAAYAAVAAGVVCTVYVACAAADAADAVRPTSYCAANAAYAAYAAYAAFYAADAYYAADDAARPGAAFANAACAAAHAVAAAGAGAEIVMQKKLIRKAVKLLEEK